MPLCFLTYYMGVVECIPMHLIRRIPPPPSPRATTTTAAAAAAATDNSRQLVKSAHRLRSAESVRARKLAADDSSLTFAETKPFGILAHDFFLDWNLLRKSLLKKRYTKLHYNCDP